MLLHVRWSHVHSHDGKGRNFTKAPRECCIIFFLSFTMYRLSVHWKWHLQCAPAAASKHHAFDMVTCLYISPVTHEPALLAFEKVS